MAAGGTRDGFGDATRTTHLRPPGREGSIEVTHVVVKQYVGGSRRFGSEERADHTAQTVVRAHDVCLEVLRQEILGAHRHDFGKGVEGVLSEALHVLAELLESAQIA